VSKRVSEEPVAVPHLCPDIVAAMRIVRRHVPVGHPDRKAALDHLKAVRDGTHQLRHNAAVFETRAKRGV
jgi:hypothetical protein